MGVPVCASCAMSSLYEPTHSGMRGTLAPTHRRPAMLDRRHFLGVFAYPAAFAGLATLAPSLSGARSRSFLAELAATPGAPDALAPDEDFWWHIAEAFTIDRSVINLNNGGVSPSPAIVQDAMK